MKNEGTAAGLALAVLALAAALLVVDSAWLHVQCRRLAETCGRQEEALAALSAQLQLHLNPPAQPQEPSLADKAKSAYEKVRSAAAKGYQAAREELEKD